MEWRAHLENRQLTQPFKQAHREIYLLTDAERETRVYSNRFAGHILRQHQLASLARERGWDYEYLGAWDCDVSGAVLKLPRCNLEVEFHTLVAGDGGETAASGVLMYVSTDRVEFRDGRARPADRGALRRRGARRRSRRRDSRPVRTRNAD